jgi:hypothetical protein
MDRRHAIAQTRRQWGAWRTKQIKKAQGQGDVLPEMMSIPS